MRVPLGQGASICDYDQKIRKWNVCCLPIGVDFLVNGLLDGIYIFAYRTAMFSSKITLNYYFLLPHSSVKFYNW